MNRVSKKQQGFTLIELMLAMAFISLLLLAIAMTIIQIGKIYSRGMALKEVNQSSRLISDSLRTTFTEAVSVDLSTDYIVMKSGSVAVGGRLCAGRYSYLWNTVNAQGVTDTSVARYEGDAKPIHFIRVTDPTQVYCQKNVDGSVRYTQVRAIDKPQTQEFLSSGDYDINMGFLTPVSPESAHDKTTGERLYTISYSIALGEKTTMTDDMTACKAPSEPGSDLERCNVQLFDVVVRAGSE